MICFVLALVGQVGGKSPDFYAWTRDPWTDANAKYARRRSQLDDMSNRQLQAVVEAAKGWTLLQSGWDDKAFDVGYACWVGKRGGQEWAVKPAIELRNMMPKIHFVGLELKDKRQRIPPNYEFHRMLFLSYASDLPESWLYPLGSRLLQKVPEDEPVVYYQAPMAADYGRFETNYAQTMKWCDWLITRHPSSAAMYSQKAWVHLLWFYKKHRKADLDGAEKYYREYDKRAPADDKFRKFLPGTLREIETYRKKYGF